MQQAKVEHTPPFSILYHLGNIFHKCEPNSQDKTLSDLNQSSLEQQAGIDELPAKEKIEHQSPSSTCSSHTFYAALNCRNDKGSKTSKTEYTPPFSILNNLVSIVYRSERTLVRPKHRRATHKEELNLNHRRHPHAVVMLSVRPLLADIIGVMQQVKN